MLTTYVHTYIHTKSEYILIQAQYLFKLICTFGRTQSNKKAMENEQQQRKLKRVHLATLVICGSHYKARERTHSILRLYKCVYVCMYLELLFYYYAYVCMCIRICSCNLSYVVINTMLDLNPTNQEKHTHTHTSGREWFYIVLQYTHTDAKTLFV